VCFYFFFFVGIRTFPRDNFLSDDLDCTPRLLADAEFLLFFFGFWFLFFPEDLTILPFRLRDPVADNPDLRLVDFLMGAFLRCDFVVSAPTDVFLFDLDDADLFGALLFFADDFLAGFLRVFDVAPEDFFLPWFVVFAVFFRGFLLVFLYFLTSSLDSSTFSSIFLTSVLFVLILDMIPKNIIARAIQCFGKRIKTAQVFVSTKPEALARWDDPYQSASPRKRELFGHIDSSPDIVVEGEFMHQPALPELRQSL
jgi:hypothetical protein